MKGIATLIVLIFIGSLAYGQANNQSAPASLKPNLPTKVYAPKTSKRKKTKGPTYDARDKFYDRLEEVNKQRRKSERAKLTPQYTEFQYFGHRKPPKKRPPEKMKYCKICGIRH
ncbi:MAG: hypothetical protein WDO15_15370 [Bacteroidota bacterium]